MPEFISMFILVKTLYNVSTEIPPKHVQFYVLIKHKFYIFLTSSTKKIEIQSTENYTLERHFFHLTFLTQKTIHIHFIQSLENSKS